MKVVAIIQARMSSTRLPGKVLLDLAGEPMLARVVERVRRVHTMSDAVVATTTEPADDVIAKFCRERDWPVFRGALHDVLDRYYRAALQTRADVVVRITSDCPLIDPVLSGEVIDKFWNGQSVDYVSNTLRPRSSFPKSHDGSWSRWVRQTLTM